MRFPHSVVLRWGSLGDVRHGMEGFCCGVGELEISSGVAPQQTEVSVNYYHQLRIKALSFHQHIILLVNREAL